MSCRWQVSSLRLLPSPSLFLAPPFLDRLAYKKPSSPYTFWRTRAKFHLCANRGTTTICSWMEPQPVHIYKPPHANGCEPNNQLLSHIRNFAGLAQGCYQAGPTTMLTAYSASLSGCRNSYST